MKPNPKKPTKKVIKTKKTTKPVKTKKPPAKVLQRERKSTKLEEDSVAIKAKNRAERFSDGLPRLSPTETYEEMLDSLKIGRKYCSDCVFNFQSGLRVICHKCWSTASQARPPK